MANAATYTPDFNQLISLSQDAVLIIDNHEKILFANPAATPLLGILPDQIVGTTLTDLSWSEAQLHLFQRALNTEHSIEKTVVALNSPSGTRYCNLQHYKLTDGNSAVVLHDVTVQHLQQRSLQNLSTTDPLTNLHNRQQLFNIATQDLSRCKRYKTAYSLLLISVDNMRQINQAYGHSMGDHALISLANQLQHFMRESDYIGRIGDSDFALGLIDATESQAETVAVRIAQVVSELKIHLANIEFDLKVSFGISRFDPALDEEFSDLLSRAEESLQQNRASKAA